MVVAPLGARLAEYLLHAAVVGVLPVVVLDEALEFAADDLALFQVEAPFLGEGREVAATGLERALGRGVEAVHQGPVGRGTQAAQGPDAAAEFLDAGHLGVGGQG